ncbi:MAG TPA: SigE family RNA polymerase sigma factor [Candidatus Limnocylindrales bacterium]|nr:SigE family RNA polymerase sigma factor [Candidatus Limnocylindrales bacterium]
MVRAVPKAGFDGFYTTHFGDTVAMTYGLTSDIDEARDITQEAFCRAWTRWQHLADYDSPITWVRRVATNLAYSRWRHLRAATTHLLRHRADEAIAAPPGLDHVTLVAGLRKLPRDQCIALVLHHMLDLPVTEVAEVLDVPVGRVKTWLHRGRHTLAAELGEELKVPATIPRGKGRRGTRKTATKTAAVLLAMVAATAGIGAVQLLRRFPPPTNQPVAQAAESTVLMEPTAVTVSWLGDRMAVRWIDPSDGYAQPFLVGGRQDEALSQLARPAKGDTMAIVTGPTPAVTFCLTVLLVYTDYRLLESDRVCTEPYLPENVL